jgi:hypothetical protein
VMAIAFAPVIGAPTGPSGQVGGIVGIRSTRPNARARPTPPGRRPRQPIAMVASDGRWAGFIGRKRARGNPVDPRPRSRTRRRHVRPVPHRPPNRHGPRGRRPRPSPRRTLPRRPAWRSLLR